MNPANSDTDGDGMPDGWEYYWYQFSIGFFLYCPDPTVPDANGDCDRDGLTNYQEFMKGTNPISADTDGDGIRDNIDPYPGVVPGGGGTPGGGSSGTPNLTVSQDFDAFGDVMVGRPSADHTYAITNTGSAPLSITTVALTGQNPTDFTRNSDTCSQTVLASGIRCFIQTSFTPKSAGAKWANLSISSNDPDTTLTNITLTGKGTVDLTPILMLLLD